MPRFNVSNPEGHPVLRPCDPKSVQWAMARVGMDVDVTEAGHSLPHHRLLFAYLNYAWKHYFIEKYPTADIFRTWVSASVGYIDENSVEVNGVMMVFRKPKSWSFRKADQGTFNGLSDAVERLLSPTVGSLADFEEHRNELE